MSARGEILKTSYLLSDWLCVRDVNKVERVVVWVLVDSELGAGKEQVFEQQKKNSFQFEQEKGDDQKPEKAKAVVTHVQKHKTIQRIKNEREGENLGNDPCRKCASEVRILFDYFPAALTEKVVSPRS